MPEQVTKKLGNSFLRYSRQHFILGFGGKYLTYDYEKQARETLKVIFELLNDSYLDKYNFDIFFDVLLKANITTIVLDEDQYSIIKYDEIIKSYQPSNLVNKFVERENLFKKILNFDYSEINPSITIEFTNYHFESVFLILLEKIQKALKEKNYIIAIIHMANHDIVYEYIEFLDVGDREKKYTHIMNKYPKYNYKEKIKDFPKIIQDELGYLISIIDFSSIYKTFYELQVNLDKKTNAAITRSRGGISFSVSEDKAKMKLNQILRFILLNEIHIDFYTEVKDLFSISTIKYLRAQLIESTLYMDEIDFYVLIRYSNKKEIMKIINDDLVKKNRKRYELRNINFKIDKKTKLYLLKSFKNICDIFHAKEIDIMHLTEFDHWLTNSLYLISMFEWSHKRWKEILDKIELVLSTNNISYALYEDIMRFIMINFNIYKKSDKNIIRIIDFILEKLSANKWNGFDNLAINNRIFDSIFNIYSSDGLEYSNVICVKKAIVTLENFPSEIKKNIAENLLLKVFSISNDQIKKLISDFLDTIFLNIWEDPKSFFSELNLIQHGLPIKQGFTDSLMKFIREYIPKEFNNIPSESTEGLGVDYLEELIRFLVEKKKLKELQPALDLLNNKK